MWILSMIGWIWLISYIINEISGLILHKQFYIVRTFKRYGWKHMLTDGWKLVLMQPILAVLSLLDLMD